MKTLLLAMLISHGENAAHFTVTCTVITRKVVTVEQINNNVSYDAEKNTPEPIIVGNLIVF